MPDREIPKAAAFAAGRSESRSERKSIAAKVGDGVCETDEGGLSTSFVSSPYRRNRCRRRSNCADPEFRWCGIRDRENP
jgi:hypothetical protein